MNDRPSSSSSGDAGAAPVVEGWLLQQQQEASGPAGPDTIQHHDQSPFVTHSRSHHHHHHHHHHHLYHHHQPTAAHLIKGATHSSVFSFSSRLCLVSYSALLFSFFFSYYYYLISLFISLVSLPINLLLSLVKSTRRRAWKWTSRYNIGSADDVVGGAPMSKAGAGGVDWLISFFPSVFESVFSFILPQRCEPKWNNKKM